MGPLSCNRQPIHAKVRIRAYPRNARRPQAARPRPQPAPWRRTSPTINPRFKHKARTCHPHPPNWLSDLKFLLAQLKPHRESRNFRSQPHLEPNSTRFPPLTVDKYDAPTDYTTSGSPLALETTLLQNQALTPPKPSESPLSAMHLYQHPAPSLHSAPHRNASPKPFYNQTPTCPRSA